MCMQSCRLALCGDVIASQSLTSEYLASQSLVHCVVQAGGRPSMSDAPADSTVGSDANDVPQASPSLTRAWWRSPSPSKRRQSSLRTGSGGGGFCMSGRNLSATLDDAVEVVKAADGGASSASTPAAAVDPEALQTLEAPPIQVLMDTCALPLP